MTATYVIIYFNIYIMVQIYACNLQYCIPIWLQNKCRINTNVKGKRKVCFYIAQYPVHWTAQSALHFSSPDRPVHSGTNSASLGSILAMQKLCTTTKSLTFPPLPIARYSFIQLSQMCCLICLQSIALSFIAPLRYTASNCVIIMQHGLSDCSVCPTDQ